MAASLNGVLCRVHIARMHRGWTCRLLPAFNTASGFPVPRFNVHDGSGRMRSAVGSTCLAEVATVSMEFSAVSRLSGGSQRGPTARSSRSQVSSTQLIVGANRVVCGPGILNTGAAA
jgi:hypothetical protein